ncbi:MAG: hypothetical protein WCF68_01325 [Terriglobales bacterium]
MTATQRTFSALIAIGATISALFLGERVGGPLARAILGPPAGFHEDFTSRAAYGQALLVQGLFVGLAFFLVGAVAALRFKKLSYRDAVWTANPITVGVGFIAYKLANHSLHLSDYLAEYDSPQIFVLFCIASPLVFALCLYAGAHARRPRHAGS